jgi:hypothetical protein
MSLIRHVTRAGLGALVAATAFGVSTAWGASPPVSNPRIVANFDVGADQHAENLTVLRDGNVDVTFSFSHQIAQVKPNGNYRIIATPPVPPDGGVNTPLGGKPITMGITHSADGTVYFAYDNGTTTTGIWRLCGDQPPVLVGKLPAAEAPEAALNGIALDEQNGMIYMADSALNVIWRVPARGGVATVWASGGALAAAAPNGIKVHNRAVWVTDTVTGTVVGIPIEQDGSAGPVKTVATFAPGQLDDFAFTGRGDSMLIALDAANEIVLLRPDGTKTVVLTGADGLDNPSAVVVAGNRVYVTSAAYFTGTDPNLLEAQLSRW